jgi:hypothetical protein
MNIGVGRGKNLEGVESVNAEMNHFIKIIAPD